RIQLEGIGHSTARAPAVGVARERQRAVRRDVDRPGGDEGAALASQCCYSRLLYTSAVCSAVLCHVKVRARARPRSIRSSRCTASSFSCSSAWTYAAGSRPSDRKSVVEG